MTPPQVNFSSPNSLAPNTHAPTPIQMTPVAPGLPEWDDPELYEIAALNLPEDPNERAQILRLNPGEIPIPLWTA